jgi:hypothetical protein
MSGVPYWPGSGQVLQQLQYVSTTQTLSLNPGGGSVVLQLSTPTVQTLSSFTTLSADVANIQQGNFSSIQVGGEQLLYQGISSATVGNLNALTGSISTLTTSNAAVGNLYNAVGQTAVGAISSLTVSSINGSPYVPGGGGSYNPNPAYSTITMAPNTSGTVGPGVINFTNSIGFRGSQDLRSALFYSPRNGAFANQIVAPGNDGTIEIGTDGTYGYITVTNNQGLDLRQPGDVFISSLTVSSINGATPGGGGSVGPNLTVSTITGPNGVANADTSFVLRQNSDGSGRSQLAYNTTDKKGFGTYPFLCPTAPAGIDMGTLCCALDSNANPAGFGIGGNSVQGALVFNDPAGANDDWILGGGGGVVHYALNTITFSTPTVVANNVNLSSINGSAFSTPNPVFSTVTTAGISSLSSINGVPFTPYTPSNVTSPFVTGSDYGGGVWQLNVDSNTGGSPQQLTSTIVLNSAHSYLVSYALNSGSNTDTTYNSITRLYAYAAGAPNDINMKNYNGFSNFWIYNGQAGSVSAILSGASATRLYATNTSPSVSSILYFDTNTSFKVTDLGITS